MPVTTSSKSVPSDATHPEPVPAPAPAKETFSSSKYSENASTEPKAAPEKLMSKLEIVAAATRARMKEIMGPRRHQGPSSGSKFESQQELEPNSKEGSKKPGSGA
jgi:hypothetical protein